MSTNVISPTYHFSDRIENESFFLNPSYQRTIQWERKTYNDFIFNIIEILKDNKTHQIYIGNFEFGVFCFNGEPCLILIDGLQRTTMLSITAYTLFRKLFEMNTNGDIDEICQKFYNIPSLEWTRTQLKNQWEDKIIYQNPDFADKIVLDRFYNGYEINQIIGQGGYLVNLTQYAKQYIDELSNQNNQKFMVDFYLTLLDNTKCKHSIVFSKTVHKCDDDSTYDYYDEYCRVNNIKQEHDDIQKLKMTIVTLAKQFGKNDASFKFDEIRAKYFENKDSLLKGFIFVCFFRNLLPYFPSLFDKTFKPEFITDTIINLQSKGYTDVVTEIFNNFYEDFSGSFIKRFTQILHLRETLQQLPIFNNNKDMVYVNTFFYTNLERYTSKKCRKNETISKMYYACIVIDKLMNDTDFETDNFDGKKFKKLLKHYISFIQIASVSETMLVDTNKEIVCKIYKNGIDSLTNDNKYKLSKEYSTYIFKELNERKDKGGKNMTQFLLSLEYTYNTDNWADELNYIILNPNLFQIDHILPKSIFNDDEKIKPILEMGVHPDEYRKKCDGVGNKRILSSDINMTHDINEHKNALGQNKNDDFILPTIEELNKKLKNKIDIILSHPYFETLR